MRTIRHPSNRIELDGVPAYGRKAPSASNLPQTPTNNSLARVETYIGQVAVQSAPNSKREKEKDRRKENYSSTIFAIRRNVVRTQL